MKNIRLFVFDFDGTLVDSKHDIADSVNHTLADLGFPQLPEKTIFSFIGDGVQTLLTRALAPHPFDDIPRAVELFTSHYEQHLLDRTEFYPNCRETLDFFSQKKYAIFSNKPARFIKNILTGLGYIDSFSSILGGDSVENKKPDPEGLHQLMQSFKVGPDEVLMVGDSRIDIETGKRANVATCGVTYGLGNQAELRNSDPDWIIDDMAEMKHLFK